MIERVQPGGEPTLSTLNAALQRLEKAHRDRFLRELRHAIQDAPTEDTLADALTFRAGLGRTSGDPTAPAWEAVAGEAEAQRPGGRADLRLVPPLGQAS